MRIRFIEPVGSDLHSKRMLSVLEKHALERCVHRGAPLGTVPRTRRTHAAPRAPLHKRIDLRGSPGGTRRRRRRHHRMLRGSGVDGGAAMRQDPGCRSTTGRGRIGGRPGANIGMLSQTNTAGAGSPTGLIACCEPTAFQKPSVPSHSCPCMWRARRRWLATPRSPRKSSRSSSAASFTPRPFRPPEP